MKAYVKLNHPYHTRHEVNGCRLVFDELGREVATLVKGVEALDRKSAQWNVSGVVGGVYFYRLSTSANVLQKKMLFLR